MASFAVPEDSEHQHVLRTRGDADITNAPATVGEYMSSVVLKELWAVQLSRHPGAFHPAAARNLMVRVAPKMSNDILEAVRGWIPLPDGICTTSLLPDLSEFPMYVDDEDGLTVQQRKLLLEALSLVFEMFNEEGSGLGENGLPLLPHASVASVSIQITAMLEHLLLMSSSHHAPALLQQGDLDLTSYQKLWANAGRKPGPGSKAELLEELQSWRSQVFALEKELQMQVKISEASGTQEKRETVKAKERLVAVNQALEEKLRSRAAEFRTASQRICDQERRISHEQALVDEKSKKILLLEAELKKMANMQDNLLLRERKYGERMLTLRMEEFMSVCRDNQRKTKMQKALNGEQTEDDEAPGEKDLAELAKDTMQRLKKEFHGFFEEREKNSNAAAGEEDQTRSEESVLADFLENASLPQGLRTSIQQSLLRSQAGEVCVGVQTDEVQVPGPGSSEGAQGPPIRASVCTGEFMSRKTSGVVQSQATMDFFKSQRRSVVLRRPLLVSRDSDTSLEASPDARASLDASPDPRADRAASPFSDGAGSFSSQLHHQVLESVYSDDDLSDSEQGLGVASPRMASPDDIFGEGEDLHEVADEQQEASDAFDDEHPKAQARLAGSSAKNGSAVLPALPGSAGRQTPTDPMRASTPVGRQSPSDRSATPSTRAPTPALNSRPNSRSSARTPRLKQRFSAPDVPFLRPGEGADRASCSQPRSARGSREGVRQAKTVGRLVLSFDRGV